MKKIFLVVAFSAIVCSAWSETRPFTYNFHDTDPTGYRKFKSNPDQDAEIIDVAIFVDGSLAGMKITSISVPVTGDMTALGNPEAFLTSKLATRNQGSQKFNAPDICSVGAEFDGNVLKAVFDEPYTITEKGVYVGYSVTDGSMEAKPVAIVPGYSDGAFWYRGSEANAKWSDIGRTTDCSSAMTVYLEGEFSPCAVALAKAEECYAAEGEPSGVKVYLGNFGTDPVTTISYTVTIGDASLSQDMTFSPEVAAKLGMPFSAVLETPVVHGLGVYEAELSIDKVNGLSNAVFGNSCKTRFEVLPFVPKNNPLVEEYTGLRCGYCPGGYVILRQMHDTYGFGNFVAIAYHGMMESGCMVHLEELPYYPSGLPACQINRTGSPSVLDIPEIWESRRKGIVPGEIEADLKWEDEDKTVLSATARARFLDDVEESPYLMSFCVVADGLSNPDWVQKNSYVLKSEEEKAALTGPYWNLFVGEDATEDVRGLVYDDVAVLYPDQQGVAGSLPLRLTAGQWYEASFTFNPYDIVNSKGESVIDPERLRVIAILNDTASGSVVTSASSLYPDGTNRTEDIVSDCDCEPVYYNLCGVRMDNPEHGIFIRINGGKAEKIVR